MSSPNDEDDPLEQLFAAYIEGSRYVAALLVKIDEGSRDLGIERSTWEQRLAGLEWFVTELLTNEHVQCGPSLVVDGRPARQLMKDGPLVTEELVAIVRELKERAWEAMQRGAGASELRPLALQCLETLWGPRWHEQLRSPDLDQGLPPT